MNAVKLSCTQKQFEALHEIVDHARAKTSTVAVSKQGLLNLLMDHGRVLKALSEAKITTETET